MASPDAFLGRHKDVPLGHALLIPSAAAGSAYDFEHGIHAVAQLAENAASGTVSDLALAAQNVRFLNLIFEAALTGAATNNFTLNLWQKRAGALLVNTTSSTAVAAAGVATITPTSMANIVIGAQLYVSGGVGTPETITVSSVSATTFTATFANTHSGTYNITSAPLATITYASGTNETALVPHQFAVPVLAANALQPGDIVTIARVSAGTGLASPAFTAELDLVPAGIGR